MEASPASAVPLGVQIPYISAMIGQGHSEHKGEPATTCSHPLNCQCEKEGQRELEQERGGEREE